MSIEELRARVAKLDTEIDLQRELLEKLERDRTLVRRQLNDILDPVARLPFEISSEIFLQSLSPFPKPGAHHTPILLCNICHAWADIALATPDLWISIHIAFPCARGLKEVLPIWLGRARNRPLSVSLDGKFDQVVIAIIWTHRQQLKHLEISNMRDDDEDQEYPPTLWRGMSSEPLPSLETLVIRAVDDERFSVESIFELMRLAPNLTECHWGIGRTESIDGGRKLVLPNLRRLTFGEHGTCPHNDDDFLHCLSLPRLETLSVSMEYVSDDSLLSFLKRSSPPLLELVLGNNVNFGSLVECLCLVPSLSRLDLWHQLCHPVEKLIAALAESPSLLPHLDTLVIHLERLEESNLSLHSLWTVLARALAARRTQFQVFRLEVPDGLPASKMPAPDIVAAFDELVTDGMHIHISAARETE